MPTRGSGSAGAALVYQPAVLGAVTVRFADAKAGVDQTEEIVVATPVTDGAVPVNWEGAQPLDVPVADLETAPAEPAEWTSLPPAAGKAKSYETWSRDLAAWVYGHRRLELLRDPASGALSRPGETERDFRVRLREVARTERDERVEALRKKFAPKRAALEERLRRAQQTKTPGRGAGLAAGCPNGDLGRSHDPRRLFGRKKVSVGNLGRATTAARGAGRVLKEREDVARAQETVAAVQQALTELDAQLQAELAELEARPKPSSSRPWRSDRRRATSGYGCARSPGHPTGATPRAL